MPPGNRLAETATKATKQRQQRLITPDPFLLHVFVSSVNDSRGEVASFCIARCR
jgi:hypothetical protein